MPASTSSNTRVGVASARASTALMASATRDSSPPDAMRASGRGGSPGLGASRNATSSAPVASSGRRLDVDRERRRPGSPARRARRVTAGARRCRGVPARAAQARRGGLRGRRAAARASAARRARSAPSPRRRSASARRRCAVREHRLLGLAVLAQQPVQRRPAAPRARRCPSAASASDVLAGRRSSSATSSTSASRPASRSARSRGRRIERAPARSPSRAARASRSRAPLPSPTRQLVRRRPAARRCAARARPRPGASRSSSTSPGRGRRRLDLVRRVLGQLEAALELGRDRSPARAARPRWRATRAPRAATASRSAAWPPNASSRSRCQAADSSRCCSCWPWISTSGSTTAASRAAVTVSSSMRATAAARGGQLAHADERLGRGRRRRRTAPRRAQPWRTVAHQAGIGARRPSPAPRASMSSDLPAPVSPVMTVSPGRTRTRARSISARSRTASSSSMLE